MIFKNVYQFRFELSLLQMKLSFKLEKNGEMYAAVLTAVHLLYLSHRHCYLPL